MMQRYLTILAAALAIGVAGLVISGDVRTPLVAEGLSTKPSPGPTDYLRIVSGGTSGYSQISQVLTPSRVSCVTTTDCTFSNLGSLPATFNNGVQPNGSSGGLAPDAQPSSGITQLTHIVPFSGTASTSSGTAKTFPNGVTFTSTSTYWCSIVNNSSTVAIELSHTSATQVTAISASSSPTYDAICIGW